MELLCDSEHERLRRIRNAVAQLDQEYSVSIPTFTVDDLQFLCRYIGELEHELWSRDHG